MRPATLLYAIIASAALVAGIVIPYLVHTGGSTAVPGWQALVSPGQLSPGHRFLELIHLLYIGWMIPTLQET